MACRGRTTPGGLSALIRQGKLKARVGAGRPGAMVRSCFRLPRRESERRQADTCLKQEGNQVSRLKIYFVVVVAAMLLHGCATQQPTIAHVHIGHATTGWVDTPGEKGLFVVAEEKAHDAAQEAQDALDNRDDLSKLKLHVGRVKEALAPAGTSVGDDASYGMIAALEGASDHMGFAAESKDASDNVKRSVTLWQQHAANVVQRCQLTVALADEVLRSQNREEAVAITEEIRDLTQQNLVGSGVDAHSGSGASGSDYGMKQLRAELQAMIDREDPPYEPVARRWLFGLIRLPSGEWVFDKTPSAGGRAGYRTYSY